METHRITIEITDTEYETLLARVDSGKFASVDEAASDAVRQFLETDPAELESWLQTVIVERARELEAHPESAVSLGEVEASLLRDRREREGASSHQSSTHAA